MKAANRQRKRRDERLSTIFRIVLSDDDDTQYEAMREAVVLIMRGHGMPHEEIGEKKGHGARKGQLFITFRNLDDTVRGYMHLKSIWPRNVIFGRQLWLERREEIEKMKIKKAWFELMELDTKEVFEWSTRDQRRAKRGSNTYNTKYSEYEKRNLAPESILKVARKSECSEPATGGARTAVVTTAARRHVETQRDERCSSNASTESKMEVDR